MHFEHLRIEALGPLKGIDTGPEALSGFVVVSGPNEAGKSTLLEALRTVLYGFYPARRDDHALTPWDGSEAEVLATLLPPEGAPFEVHRRLLATPWGRLRRNGEESDLRNRNIPGVEHVPQEIFRQVHHLTLPELMALQEGDAWKLVRDRIMAGMGTRDFLPPREVAEALVGSAQALWRPDRRGTPADRALAAEVDRRSAELIRAREGDRAFREAEAALGACETALAELREEQARLRLGLDRVRTLIPLETRLAHLQRLEERAGDRTLLDALPTDPAGHLAGLAEAEAEAEEALAEAGSREAEMEASLPHLDEATLRVAALVDPLEALRGPVSVADEALERVRQRTRTLALERERLADLLHPVLEPEAVPPVIASAGEPAQGDESTAPARELELRISRIPMDELRHLLARMEETRVRLAGVEEQREQAQSALKAVEEGRTGAEPPLTSPAPAPGSTSPSAGSPSTTPWILGAMGALLVVAGALFLLLGRGGEVAPWLTLLAGFVLLGVALLLRERAASEGALARARTHAQAEARAASEALARRSAREEARRREEEVERLEARVAELRRELEEARQGLARHLEAVPLAPGRLAHPGDALVTALERIVDTLRELRRLAEDDADDRDRVDRVAAALAELERKVDPDTSDVGGLLPRFQGLVRVVTAARERVGAREAGMEELERIREEARVREGRLTRCREAREAFELRLREVAGDSAPEVGTDTGVGPDASPGADPGEAVDPGAHASGDDPLTRVRARMEAAANARRVAAELEGEHGPLPDLRVRVREASSQGPLSDEVVARMEARLEALREEIERRLAEAGDHRGVLRQMEDRETVDLVESDLARLEEERARVRRERDRLWLLSRVVRVAEQRFREAHQPELVRQAEGLLRTLTGGRYDTLLLGDDEGADLLQVRGPHLPDALPADIPLSTGTREQIWFALRMAVVPLVEGSGPPLPLVLDEVFVNWDRHRRAQALEALRELSGTRQVFLVTCHRELAAEAREHGARWIPLEGP